MEFLPLALDWSALLGWLKNSVLVISTLVAIYFAARQVNRYQHNQSGRELLQEFGLELLRRMGYDSATVGKGGVRNNPNSMRGSMERQFIDGLYNTAKPVLKRATDESREAKAKMKEALRSAGQAFPSTATILSLSKEREKLKSIFLRRAEANLDDSMLFVQLSPILENVIDLLLDDERFIKVLTAQKSLIQDQGYTVEVNEQIHMGDRTALAKDGAANLTYDLRSDSLVGRKDLIDRLVADFLNIDSPPEDDRHFRWTLIYGRAGSGKSRFAVELLRDARTGRHFFFPDLFIHGTINHRAS